MKQISLALVITLTIVVFSCCGQRGIATASKLQTSRANMKIKRDTPSCYKLMSGCTKNSTCKSTLKTLKKKCQSKGNHCLAEPEYVQVCSMKIKLLKESVFQEKCECLHVHRKSPKKMMKCLEIYNMIYANPCYDLAHLEEKKKLALMTTLPLVANPIEDTSSYLTTSDVPTETTKHSHSWLPSTVGNNISQTSRNVTALDTSKKQQTEKDEIRLTEDELFSIDKLMQIANHQPPSHDKPLVTKRPYGFKRDDVNHFEDTVNDLSEATTEISNNSNDRSDIELDYHHSSKMNDHDVNKNTENKKHHSNMNDVSEDEVVARVAQKVMEISSMPKRDYEIETESEFEQVGPVVEAEPSSQLKDDNYAFQLSSIHIVLICISSVILMLTLLGLFLLHFRRSKRLHYFSSAHKKKCRSAVIVKSTYDDNDLNPRRNADHV